jgi:hypothetical protein
MKHVLVLALISVRLFANQDVPVIPDSPEWKTVGVFPLSSVLKLIQCLNHRQTIHAKQQSTSFPLKELKPNAPSMRNLQSVDRVNQHAKVSENLLDVLLFVLSVVNVKRVL